MEKTLLKKDKKNKNEYSCLKLENRSCVKISEVGSGIAYPEKNFCRKDSLLIHLGYKSGIY